MSSSGDCGRRSYVIGSHLRLHYHVLTRPAFVGDYTHTLMLMIIILYFYFYTYTEAELIGGFQGMYQKVQQAAVERPVADNAGGSYMTLKSNCASALFFPDIGYAYPQFRRARLHDHTSIWRSWDRHARPGMFLDVTIKTSELTVDAGLLAARHSI